MIDLSQSRFRVLHHGTTIRSFDCGDHDLNSFLSDDALHYLDERMAVTYVLEYREQIIAYFCLLNDKIVFDTTDAKEKSFWNRFNRKHEIPNPKRRRNYPAAKIGRLAVATDFGGQGAGRFIIENIKTLLAKKNDIGCRFLTVDAYLNAVDFYLKNQFQILSDKDAADPTRLMYYDLKQVPVVLQ
jgi:predicted GNAT family N-acyltransferase